MAERLRKEPNTEPSAIVNIVGMGGKIASDIHIAGGAANVALMLNSRSRALLREARHPHQRDQSGIDAHPGAWKKRSHSRRSVRASRATKRSPAVKPKYQWVVRETGKDRGRRAVSGEPPRELHVGRDHPDGRSVVADHLMRRGLAHDESAELDRYYRKR